MMPLFDATHAIEAIRANPQDEEAWSAFYGGFRRQIIGTLALGGIGDRDVREELCAEVFFRFVRYSPWRSNWSTLPDASTVSAYLRRTAQNALKTWQTEMFGTPQTDTADPLTPSAESGILSVDLLNRLRMEDRRFLHAYIRNDFMLGRLAEIGRASCRERV